MPLKKSEILSALGNVVDPDFKRDIVSLGMVEDLNVEGKIVEFRLVLTTPACPMKDYFIGECQRVVREQVDPEARVRIVFSSRVTSVRAKTAVLPGVRNIIAVASGKGGVGKSTIACNLALALGKVGASVGLIDADIHGPSIPLMLGIRGRRPGMIQAEGKQKITPVEVEGIKALSIGLLVDEQQAVVWRGPMVSSALRQFVTDCHWGELDYLIIDLPPGTGDVHLTLVQTMPVTGAIVVTTPQKVAIADARKAVSMFRMPQINVPVLGIVENMSWFTPYELPGSKYYLFGKGGGEALSKELGVPLLGQIPLVQSIQEGGDAGKPTMTGNDELTKGYFERLAASTAQQISIRNANFEPTRIVEITT